MKSKRYNVSNHKKSVVSKKSKRRQKIKLSNSKKSVDKRKISKKSPKSSLKRKSKKKSIKKYKDGGKKNKAKRKTAADPIHEETRRKFSELYKSVGLVVALNIFFVLTDNRNAYLFETVNKKKEICDYVSTFCTENGLKIISIKYERIPERRLIYKTGDYDKVDLSDDVILGSVLNYISPGEYSNEIENYLIEWLYDGETQINAELCPRYIYDKDKVILDKNLESTLEKYNNTSMILFGEKKISFTVTLVLPISSFIELIEKKEYKQVVFNNDNIERLIQIFENFDDDDDNDEIIGYLDENSGDPSKLSKFLEENHENLLKKLRVFNQK
jgi:hypothetical protein